MKNFKKLVKNMASMCAVLVLGFGLSACSSGIGDTELELNGKIFDALGITSSGQKDEAKIADRAPLVLPPDDKKLPVPGQAGSQSAALAWPDDPDIRKIRMAKQAAKKKELDCNGGDFKKDQGVDAIAKASDPLKDCSSGNLLTAIGIGRPKGSQAEDAQ